MACQWWPARRLFSISLTCRPNRPIHWVVDLTTDVYNICSIFPNWAIAVQWVLCPQFSNLHLIRSVFPQSWTCCDVLRVPDQAFSADLFWFILIVNWLILPVTWFKKEINDLKWEWIKIQDVLGAWTTWAGFQDASRRDKVRRGGSRSSVSRQGKVKC